MADGALVQNLEDPLIGFADHDPLFRVLKKKKYLDREKLSEAFMLGTNETGLSVCFDCPASEAQAISNLDSEGVASLTYGGVTALVLTVVADGPNHAEIRGVPFKETNRPEAERLAIALAEAVTSVLTKRYRKPI